MTVDQIPIGRFSVVTRLSLKALRYYDEKGILAPKAKDPFIGYSKLMRFALSDAWFFPVLSVEWG
jgi:hypothetical protein